MEPKLSGSRSSVNYTVSVSDLHGNDTLINVLSPEMPVEKLKEIAIKQLPGSESSTNYGQFRLVLINDIPRQLCDDKSVKQELLEEGDCALLVKNRNKQVSSLVKDGIISHEAPTSSDIARVTEGLPVFNGPFEKLRSQSAELSSPTQVEQTFRKVLLSLLDLSYKFMHFDQDEGDANSSAPEVDPGLLKFLVDMGFSENRARKALIANNMDKNLAMEWLLNNTEPDEVQSSSQADEPMDTNSAVTATTSGMKTRSRTFVPNPTHLSALVDMGFTREECMQALRISGNNVNTACEWLLSDHKDNQDMEDDSDEPLRPDSELYKALISNPTIHIGLHDKKVLEALEDMVENPWRRNNWAYESAVGNVLLQILKLYNKYSSTGPQT